MLLRKINLYPVVFILLLLPACTKQEIVPSSAPSTSLSDTSYAEALRSPLPTAYGLLEQSTTDTQKKTDMKTANVNVIRLSIYLSQASVNKVIDHYLSAGYHVQISMYWFTGTNLTRGFPGPTDTSTLRSQANAFFQYYQNRESQISFVSIENEWDHTVELGANLQDYINELSIMTQVGHNYGFKIADGGITYASLQRWTYSQLTGTAQQLWRQNYFVGLHNNYDSFLNMVNTYISAVKNIDFDYSNVHWYNITKCSNGYRKASHKFMVACNKKTPVCNEFGIETSLLSLFTQTVKEINGNALYAIAYSGTNQPNKAISLNNSMLQVLATP
jgi:hypothetical protein